MIASHRFSFLLGLMIVAITSLIHAQESMMLRNNSAPAAGVAINRGDFNNDGILDLVMTDGTAVSVFLGRADGTFASPINTSNDLPTQDLAVGDFNNDGKLDVAVTNVGNHSIQVMLGNGDGTFQTATTILFDQEPASITTADFNNDGKMDLAVGIGVTTNQGVTTDEVDILQGDGAGHFVRVNTLTTEPSVGLITKVRVGDFNRDGKVDLAVLEQKALSVWWGNGDFTFGADVVAQYAQTNDMSTGDQNQDSFTDILVSWFDSPGVVTGGVDVFYGGPSSSVTRKGQIVSGQSPSGILWESPGGILTADVNGDGVNDIVGLSNDGTFADGLYVWLCNGEGSCSQSPTKFIYTTDRDKQALVAGDFNRDGKIDFAAVRQGNGTVEVLLNATPRAVCQKNVIAPAMTVCQPQDATFSHSPLHIVAQTDPAATDIDVFIDNVKKGSFASSSINQFFTLPTGNHFVVVKGFLSDGSSFRSDRHVSIFSGAH